MKKLMALFLIILSVNLFSQSDMIIRKISGGIDIIKLSDITKMYFVAGDTVKSSSKTSVISSPSGITFYLDNGTALYTTPKTFYGLAAGDHSFKFIDGTDTSLIHRYLVTAGVDTINYTSYYTYTDVQMWATNYPTGPAALILSTGQAISFNNSNKRYMDIYYNYADSKLRSAFLSIDPELLRKTYFYQGASANIEDGVDAVTYSSTSSLWTDRMPDRDTTHYYFVYDNDGHYSKLLVTSAGGTGLTGDYSWVKVKWYYKAITGAKGF